MNLKRLILFFLPWRCSWHKGMDAENWNDHSPSCPDCGCLLDTKTCERCGKDFLDFGSNSYDDVMASPTVTSHGDLACVRCAERDDDRYDYERDDDRYDYDPDSDFGERDPYHEGEEEVE